MMTLVGLQVVDAEDNVYPFVSGLNNGEIHCDNPLLIVADGRTHWKSSVKVHGIIGSVCDVVHDRGHSMPKEVSMLH